MEDPAEEIQICRDRLWIEEIVYCEGNLGCALGRDGCSNRGVTHTWELLHSEAEGGIHLCECDRNVPLRPTGLSLVSSTRQKFEKAARGKYIDNSRLP